MCKQNFDVFIKPNIGFRKYSPFYHLIAEIDSYPTMYNTWGCSLGCTEISKSFQNLIAS